MFTPDACDLATHSTIREPHLNGWSEHFVCVAVTITVVAVADAGSLLILYVQFFQISQHSPIHLVFS